MGVVGGVGSGKSSLLNSLVDEELILPCNSFRASTAVAVELSWNKSEDPAQSYAAEVEFISFKDWQEELRILFQDIQARTEGEHLESKHGTEASVAYSKISAVYPGVDLEQMTPDEVLQQRDLSDILGHTIRLHENTLKKFYKAINGYIDSHNKGSKKDQIAYWPLLRCVKVFLKSPLLKTGLCLVDLPGLGDSNAGRTSVTETYISQLDYVWIVADINRALDDQIAKDLQDRAFKRNLLMAGNLHTRFITFITTKTDIVSNLLDESCQYFLLTVLQINTDEAIETLDLGESSLKEILVEEEQLVESLDHIRDQMSSLNLEQKELRREIKKLQAEARAKAKDSQEADQ